MSLVSPRNLLLPFTNKVHLVTIILVGVLFAALRLSGGGITTKSQPAAAPGPAAPVVGQPIPAAVAPTVEPSRRLVERTTIAIPKEQEGDLLKSLLKTQRAKPTPSKRSGGGLDDIERQLGLAP